MLNLTFCVHLLKTLVHLSELPMQNTKLPNRQERADVICEAFRAFDVTGKILSLSYPVCSLQSILSSAYELLCVVFFPRFSKVPATIPVSGSMHVGVCHLMPNFYLLDILLMIMTNI